MKRYFKNCKTESEVINAIVEKVKDYNLRYKEILELVATTYAIFHAPIPNSVITGTRDDFWKKVKAELF